MPGICFRGNHVSRLVTQKDSESHSSGELFPDGHPLSFIAPPYNPGNRWPATVFDYLFPAESGPVSGTAHRGRMVIAVDPLVPSPSPQYTLPVSQINLFIRSFAYASIYSFVREGSAQLIAVESCPSKSKNSYFVRWRGRPSVSSCHLPSATCKFGSLVPSAPNRFPS